MLFRQLPSFSCSYSLNIKCYLTVTKSRLFLHTWVALPTDKCNTESRFYPWEVPWAWEMEVTRGNQDAHAWIECSSMLLHDGLYLTWPLEMQWQGSSSQRRLSQHCVIETRRLGIDAGSVQSRVYSSFWIKRDQQWSLLRWVRSKFGGRLIPAVVAVSSRAWLYHTSVMLRLRWCDN